MSSATDNLLWKVFAAVMGLLMTLTATGVTGLVAFMFVVNGDLSRIDQKTTNTETTVQELGGKLDEVDGKVDSLDRRLTQLEEKDQASEDKIAAFWDREWPALRNAINQNRDAIQDLEREIRSKRATGAR